MLGLPANSPYGPQVLGWLARLGATLPFAQAAALLAELTGLQEVRRVSATTVRRHTQALGATAVALAEEEVARLVRLVRLEPGSEPEPPPATAPPERLVLGADGAMAPLVGGEWGEVKLVGVGEPKAARGPGGPARTTALSYFARLADAESFGLQARGELKAARGRAGGSGGRRARRGTLAARLCGLSPARCAAHPRLAACRRASLGRS